MDSNFRKFTLKSTFCVVYIKLYWGSFCLLLDSTNGTVGFPLVAQVNPHREFSKSFLQDVDNERYPEKKWKKERDVWACRVKCAEHFNNM